MDKVYSRVASRMAIPQLFDEINVLKEPLRAEQRFRLMAIDKAIASAFLGTVAAGSEVSLEQRFEVIIHLMMREEGGYVS